MTHLPFVAGAYGLSIGMALWLGISAAFRLGRARRRLDAVDGRGLERHPEARRIEDRPIEGRP